ncbi:TonB-dependent receptor [Sphingomonas sp. C8-2]|jgi:outer membrane receptor protein involved in Fe transport|uniref:Outer membrane receptor proteins, mostly Fe transport n=1 Tax=Rhizorhabdus histidinilytica TaxID=439228 RepID=A0A1T5GTV6_9SPHN|nr:TonB-dependent receptor [Rhizorhabdus histidinilytica]QEH77836.1 TonB-dependent receptor [Sphingomonas sp. C8-2]SKC11808.1 Outer membrane receptor proteins, mostly Fe transport [Rhizorhabdus histidinilytica]
MGGRQRLIAGIAVILAPMPAMAAEETEASAPIVVTAPGGAIDLDDAISLTGDDIARAGRPDLIGALTRQIAGISLQDAQNNPWQPNLVYRGFTASPLQGQAQGLAVYLDGARFNQPFGDTVQFDLIPEAAIRRLSVLDTSPVYGLNALGGAILLDTKTGASDPGLEASATGGRFGYSETSLSGGLQRGAFSAFGAFQHSREHGWRDHSPSRLYNGYADLGFDIEGGGMHLKLVGADTDLTGNGVAPVELLAADRRAVFTWPDNSRSRYGRISLHPWVALSERTRLEGTLYAQRLTLRTVNGDAADIEGCEDDDDAGLVCLEAVGGDEEEAQARLIGADGLPVADLLGGEGYGVLNRGRTRTDAMGALFQIIDERPLGAGDNHFALGLSYDTSRTRFTTSTELGELTDERSVDGLGTIIVQPDGAIAPIGLVAHADYWGVFVQDRLPILPGLSAEIGLRYNHARIRLVDRIGTALNGRHDFDRVNPGIELDYRVGPGLTLRAGYAESNRAPTPAELSCADPAAPCSLTNFFVADPPLRQVVARNWEAGASGSGEPGGVHLEWLLSAYRATNRNDIQYIASAIRGRAYFQNVGSTRRQGIEARLKARRGGLAATLGYAFTDARYRTPLTLSSPANPATGADGTIAVARGDRLPGIPRHSATLAIDYAGRGWSVGGDMIVRSGQYLVGDEGNDNPRLGGYAVFNLRGSVDLIRGVTLFAELRNLFDRRYATFGTFSEVSEIELDEAPGASNPRAYGPGAPRRWYAGMRVRL